MIYLLEWIRHFINPVTEQHSYWCHLTLAIKKPSENNMISQICPKSGTMTTTGLNNALTLSGSSVLRSITWVHGDEDTHAIVHGYLIAFKLEERVKISFMWSSEIISMRFWL